MLNEMNAPDTPEPEIVAHLFKLYAEKSKE